MTFMEEERAAHPQLYPSTLQYRRFNDALFVGIDAEHLVPPPGQTTLTGGYTMEQLRKLHPESGAAAFEGTTAESASEVAKLVGLVARIHSFVNACERTKSFPGCRTVVTSGLRQCFRNREGGDDFFSLNISVAMAFEAQQRGSSAGMGGNHLYVENDVAVAMSYHRTCAAILGFSKFLPQDPLLVVPYHYQPERPGSVSLPRVAWTSAEPINLTIMRKELCFSRLNAVALTNLQLFRDYQELEGRLAGDELTLQVGECLRGPTPSIEQVNEAMSSLSRDQTRYPFLSLMFSLGDDYSRFFADG
jgi:hypothetical protein